ncbi:MULTISPECIES: hypothetical protein [Paenibacillus]|uniref:hypothetical protein n=1 Tax=Paenibacillus TaxID=44249 RepID=UPI0022B92350|nr:hypothetical protein [Paenibacillus caseinilyticus]MCZ8523818.1 hypothetical protein [Paenibacillus caseinilyticus]
MSKSNMYFGLSVLVFLSLLGLSYRFESIYLLYAASAMPILITMLLPNRQGHQFIKASKRYRFRLEPMGGDPSLSVTFAPGDVRWTRGKLYLPLKTVRKLKSTAGDSPEAANAPSLSVLPYDLSLHPSKKGWVGIDLLQLAERTRSLSYTTHEVSRLVIRISDLEAAAAVKPGTSPLPAAAAGERLQA